MKNDHTILIALSLMIILLISGCVDNRREINFEVVEIREEMVKCKTGSSKNYLMKTNITTMMVICTTCGNRNCSELTRLKKGDKATLKVDCLDRDVFEGKLLWVCKM